MGMGDIATTGMQAAMSNMDVISNNISNANTLGFKKSTATFADLFPSGNDASGVQIGLGVTLDGVQQNFQPGGFSDTGLPSDMCITGQGFFILKSPSGGSTYTRNGHFTFDSANGYFNVGNQRLQGFPAVNGNIPAGSTPTDLKVNTAAQAANASTNVAAQGLNLNSGDTIPTITPFDQTNTASYNYTNHSTMYDSLGNPTNLDLYYVKSAANTWSVYTAVNGTVTNAGSPANITFGSDGQIASTSGLTALSYTPTTGASGMTFDINMAGTTQYGNPDTTTSPFSTDGYPAGTFSKYTIDNNGVVTAIYSNGPPVTVGQVALATFQSPQNLQNLGGATWAATTASGAPVSNPGNSTGSIKQAALEMSNVDLASELVNLINAQNTFQANAQVEQTYNQVMQTVTKL